jgi:hypothetical protein
MDAGAAEEAAGAAEDAAGAAELSVLVLDPPQADTSSAAAARPAIAP